MFVRMVNNCLIINVKQISLFYAENVLKMRRMRKSANYADPHHRILSDALIKCFLKKATIKTRQVPCLASCKLWPWLYRLKSKFCQLKVGTKSIKTESARTLSSCWTKLCTKIIYTLLQTFLLLLQISYQKKSFLTTPNTENKF